MKKIELNIQLFADKADFSAVSGQRMFISETLPIKVTDQVLGVRSTPDLGASENKVDATCISDTREVQVDGVIPASDMEWTFALSKATLTAQMAYIQKKVWIYTEHENMSTDPTKIGSGTVVQVKLGGLNPTGLSSGNLEEFTQSGTQISEEVYLANQTGSSVTYTGLTTGVVKALTTV